MATKIGSHLGKRLFWSKFETCNRGIDIEHKQILKKNIRTDDENYHGTQNIKSFFWYLLVLISNP